MARTRSIKPSFFKNEDLVELDFPVRLLFISLWTLADREGRLEDRPKRIKMEMFPADNFDVDSGLNDLERFNFLVRYEVDGKKYIQIENFTKHQNPHHMEAASEIPPPPCNDLPTSIQEQTEYGSSSNREQVVNEPSKGEKSRTNPACNSNLNLDSNLNLIETHTVENSNTVAADAQNPCVGDFQKKLDEVFEIIPMQPNDRVLALPKIRGLLQAGATKDLFVAGWSAADVKDKGWRYALGAVEGMLADGSRPKARASPKSVRSFNDASLADAVAKVAANNTETRAIEA